MIPCRNEARSIGPLLDALATQTLRPAEIIIVDDRSTDDTVAAVGRWAQDHPGDNVRLIAGAGRGPGPAMNAGIAASTADVIVRLDGHCVPARDYIEHSASVLARPKAGVAGGVWHVIAGDTTGIAEAIARVVSHPLGSGGARYRHPDAPGPESMSVETVPFGAFHRSLWEVLGGFDESLAANQDFDFNYRARRAGFDVVLDRRIRATYVARPTLDALRRQYFRYGFWKQQMLRKDLRAIHWRQLPPIFLLPWLIATAVAVIAWPSWLTAAAAALYPIAAATGALHLSTRGARFGAALAALVTLHLGWSAGFWHGAIGGHSPVR